jgi:hypothetical protein
MQLTSLQRQLEAVYDLDCGHRVEDFLLTDRATAKAIGGCAALSGTPEALLVRQDGEHLDISLYLDEALLGRLSRFDPSAGVDTPFINDLCVAVEGVSHFLYLIWNAGYQRPVTQLELELQAEVDKFVTWVLLIDEGESRGLGDGVHHALFGRYRLREDLTEDQRTRYRRANELASRYCRSLLGSLSGRPRGRVLTELRRFYRMTQRGKIRHIQATSGPRH